MIDDRNDLEFITDDIDTVSEESVDEVSEVSQKTIGQLGVIGRATTVPTSEQTLGRFNYIRTIGGAETTEYTTGKFQPQGTAEVSFTLSGDILSVVPAKNFSSDSYSDLQSNQSSLNTLIQNAYQETIADANTGFKGTTLTDRKKLCYALRAIFEDSESETKVKFIFHSNNNDVKIIPFKSESCFPNDKVCPDYIKYIIDLEAMNTRTIEKNRIASTTEIPIKMMIRVKNPQSDSSLQTNTEYKFIGLQDQESFKVATSSNGLTGLSGKEYIIGFNMGNFKTKKASAHITTKFEVTGSSNIHFVYPGIGANTDSSTSSYTETYVYLNTITKSTTDPTYSNIYTTFIDMKILRDRSGINSSGDMGSVAPGNSAFKSPIEISGTSIKIKPLQFKDLDNTITKIEVEDNRGELYKGKLSVDSSDPNIESGVSFLEITDLQRSMPYIFTKLHVTSNYGDKDEIKNFHFVSYENWTASGDLVVNTLPIRTTHFYGPKLILVNNPKESNKLLPDGLEVKSVKNDRTALRYIIKPDNTEGTLGDITINGLRDEKYKIEKVLDSDGKISYWILTLYNLMPDYDYGFLILELSYTDPNGNQSITRQALAEINKDYDKDTKIDNRTEKTDLPLNEQFEIVVKDKVEAKDPRSVEIPVFVDDIHGKFAGIEMTPAKECPDAKATYETGKIKVTDLTPDKTGVCRVDFLHNPDADNNSTYEFRNSNIQRIARYITITTPKVSDLDIKSATATVDMTTAEFKFEYYSDPKSPIKTVVVKDSAGKEIKSSFDKTTNVLKLEGLTEETKYSKVKVTFTLENSKTIEYTLEDFTTKKKEEEKPTGKVAEFVAKVYKLALGREPEVEGWKFWVQKLESKELAVTQFIYDLMKQDEFVSRLMSREQFIKMMYEIIVGREPEEEGQKYWEQKYEEYRTQEPTLADVRMRIAREMMDTAEFKAYVASLGLKY